MPNISEFRTPQLGLRPSEIGVEATAAAARRAGAFYNQAGEAKANMGARLGRAGAELGDVVVAHEDHAQINAGAAKGTELYDNLMQSKDEVIKNIDPNDPAYGPKVEAAIKGWRETIVEDSLSKFREGFTTQKSQEWADHFINTTRDHMFKHSAADIMDAAGIGVNNSIKQTVSRASNLALRNPETVDDQLELLKHSADGIVDSSPMKGIASAKLKSDVYEHGAEKIVKNGALGAIQKSSDPEATANEWIKKYPQYINGDEARQFAQAARAQIRMNTDDARRQQAHLEHEEKLGLHKGLNDLEFSTMPKNVGDAPTLPPDYYKKIQELALKYPNAAALEPDRLRTMINGGEAITQRLNKPEPRGRLSHDTQMRLLDDVWSGRMRTPDPIQEEYKKGNLNWADFNSVRKEFYDSRSPEGERLGQRVKDLVDGFKNQITKSNPLMGKSDPDGDEQLYNFKSDIQRKIDDYRRQGKPIDDLFDRTKPDFVGNPKNIEQYTTPLDKSLKTKVNAISKRSKEVVGETEKSLPPGMKNDPDGTVVYDASSKPWVKQGDKLMRQ